MNLEKATINHLWSTGLFMAGLVASIWFSPILAKMIVPYAYEQTLWVLRVAVGICYCSSWVLRGFYKTNRSLSISDMGELDLRVYIGALQQIEKVRLENKNERKEKTFKIKEKDESSK